MTAERDDVVYRPPSAMVMRAEFGSDSPFWTMSGRYVDLESLPLTLSLKQQLYDWAKDIDRARGDDASPTALLGWVGLGQSLHAVVVEELGPEFNLVFEI
jgi:hypothetical protein